MENISTDMKAAGWKYLNLHLGFLEAAAMWPVRKFRTKYLNEAIFFFLMISVTCQNMLMITEHAYLLKSTSEPLEIIAYIGTSCLSVEALGKILYMVIIRRKLKHLLNFLETSFKLSARETFENSNSQGTKDYAGSTMKSWSLKAKTMAALWVGLCLFGSIQWALVPLGINGEVTVVVDDYQVLDDFTDNVTVWSTRMETIFVRILPLRGWFPFNVTKSPVYEITYFLQITGSISNAFAVGAFDQFYCAILLIVCGQFECLKKSLQNITFNEDSNSPGKETRKSSLILDNEDNFSIEKEDPLNMEELLGKGVSFFGENHEYPNDVHSLRKLTLESCDNSIINILPERRSTNRRNGMEVELKECIKHHQSIISVVRYLNSIYSPVIYFQCQKSLLALCLVAFEGTMEIGNALRLFSLVEYVLLLVIQLFIYCWCASELTLRASSVKDAVYRSSWTDASTSYKTSMKIMIHYCQIPLVLTDGAFYRLTMGLFIELLRLSFSTFTVLREVHEGK